MEGTRHPALRLLQSSYNRCSGLHGLECEQEHIVGVADVTLLGVVECLELFVCDRVLGRAHPELGQGGKAQTRLHVQQTIFSGILLIQPFSAACPSQGCKEWSSSAVMSQYQQVYYISTTHVTVCAIEQEAWQYVNVKVIAKYRSTWKLSCTRCICSYLLTSARSAIR